jgi:hypothetical protein
MRIILFSVLACLVCSISEAQSSVSFTDMNNQTVQTDTFQNRKIMVMLLPAQPDTSLLGQLTRFASRHAGQIRVLALVDISSATPMPDSSGLIYQSLSTAGIIVSKGIPSIPQNAGRTDALLYWMTGKSRDRRGEAGAPGRKYFIGESGQLYAVLGPETSLDIPTADYLVNTQVPPAIH